MSILLGILYGIICMISFGLTNGISKTLIKNTGVKRTLFFRYLFTAIIFSGVLLLFPPNVFSLVFILIAIFISIIGYLAIFSFFKGLEKGKVGVISSISNSSIIFTTIFSVLFFSEIITSMHILSISLIFIGIILISINIKDFKNSSLLKLSKGVPYALLTCFLWGLAFSLLKIPVTILGPVFTSFINDSFVFLFSGANIFLSKTKIKIPKKELSLAFLAGFFGTLGTLSYNLGIMYANISLVAPIMFSQSLVATIYGKIIHKDKLRKLQYLAIIITIIGIILISNV